MIEKLTDPDQDNLFFQNESGIRLLLEALNASISGIIVTDNQQPDNPIIYCNKAFENMTGYSRQDIIGHNCRFLQRDDRNQKARLDLRKAVEEGLPIVTEIRNYRKDGTLFWNELYVSPVTDQAGNVNYFIGVQNEVTRRKKAEQDVRKQQDDMEQKIAERTRSLKESEEYLSSIIETVRESLMVLDPDLNVLSVNEFFLRTFKVTDNETIGRGLFDLGNGQWNIKKLRELLEQILPTSNPVLDFEVDHTFPHIGRKLMLVNAYRIELEGKYKDRILIAIEDITDRRAIETRKDDFLSIASHELRTPLTTIKGYMQLLQKSLPENTEDKTRKIVNKSEVSIDRLEKLIDELLNVSRIQSGKIELHHSLFDFDKMVEETVETMQESTPTHELRLTGKTGKSVMGDETHLVQVVTNLLSNAIKYSPKNSVITVHLAQVSNYVKLSVSDKGLGIHHEDQKKIFERFYRVNDVQTRFPGLGIGLYVCDQIIKNHKGTLWVDSEHGKGATFSFTLPLQ